MKVSCIYRSSDISAFLRQLCVKVSCIGAQNAVVCESVLCRTNCMQGRSIGQLCLKVSCRDAAGMKLMYGSCHVGHCAARFDSAVHESTLHAVPCIARSI